MLDYKTVSLANQVYARIESNILNGVYAKGEIISESKLSEELGVSRTPIREAMRKLEQEGLVIMMPRRGAQVAQITEKDLVEVLEVRLGLEEMAVRFACERMTDEQFKSICAAAAEFDAAIEKNDLTALAQADENFHSLIYKATDNACLCNITNNLREQTYREPAEVDHPNAERKIIKALVPAGKTYEIQLFGAD